MGGDDVEGADEQGVVLARLDRADRQHVGRSSRDLLVGGHIGKGGNALGDRVHAVGAHAEQLDHLGGHELRWGVHEGAARQRPPDQRFVGEGRGMGQLREAHRREVVHGDDLTRVASGGHDEVRAVHDIDLVRPPLDRRPVPPHPRPPQRPGGHRAPRRPHAARHKLADLGPAPPRHGVGDGVDDGPGREGAEHAGREHADARAGAEQGRGVQCDLQRLGRGRRVSVRQASLRAPLAPRARPRPGRSR